MIYLFLGTKSVWFQSKTSHVYSFSPQMLPLSAEQQESSVAISKTCLQARRGEDQTGAGLGLVLCITAEELCAIHLSASS